MPAFGVVEPFNVIEDADAQFVKGTILTSAEALRLQGGEEAFHCCVIPTISAAAQMGVSSFALVLTLTGWSFEPSIEPASRHTQKPAHRACGPHAAMTRNKAVLHSGATAK